LRESNVRGGKSERYNSGGKKGVRNNESKRQRLKICGSLYGDKELTFNVYL